MQEILALNAALALVENLLPMVAALVKSGQVTAAEQTELRQRYEILRAKADTAFEGPEWEA
jgi:glutamine synthetase adenylyltransferase